jgi:hypothetical protein
VESVGATRSTCLSTATSAGLLPMICPELLRIILGKPLRRCSLLSGAMCADTASSISKDAVGLTAGSLLAQLVCADILYHLSVVLQPFDTGTPRSWLALTSATLSRDPLADISCAILQFDTIRFAAFEKADGISTDQS